MEKALNWVNSNQQSIIANIKELLSIPSISAEPEFKNDVLKAAEWVKANFERMGLETKMIETVGYPVVFAQTKQDPNKPTVLIYFHYDVQPTGEASLWETAAFEPTEKEGKIFGRGSTDDKMQGLIHATALEAIINSGEELPVNFKFCIEGEEEISSPNVGNIVKENKELFDCDYIIISDGPMMTPDLPSIEVGARGIVYTQIKVTTGTKDLHSGQFGGYVKNANLELAKILANLKDENGKINIAGFYDDVDSPTEDELKAWKAIPKSLESYKEDSGVFALDEGEKGFSLTERNWSRPCVEVNGIWGGFIGEGTKTVIPFDAHAKVSFRIVPNQDPEKVLKQFEAFLQQFNTEGVKVEIEFAEKAPAFLAEPADPVFKKATETYGEVFGTEALLIRTGGTIGLLADLKEAFGKPILLLSFGSPDENMHAPNEFMRLSNFWRGVEVSIRLLHKIGK
jgi:acetylornithine deacetylase/succinyl-diaminopimelate desuccinylase-like protein